MLTYLLQAHPIPDSH